MEQGKSYFYVFVEDPYERDRVIKEVFNKFAAVHKVDSKVEIYSPQEVFGRFDEARKAFDILRLPAFAVADEEQSFDEFANPSLSLDRGILEMYKEPEDLYRFISDLHYLIRDENILRVKRKVAEARIGDFVKRAWTEIKDFVSVNIGV